MSLYEIIKSLQNAQGNIAKQAILDEHKDNVLFKEYMRAVYDPAINYWQKKLRHKDLKTWKGVMDFDAVDIKFMLNDIAGRKVTGLAAEASLNGHVSALNHEGRELVQHMLDHKIGASVGDTMVLKTWPDLYFTVPYQRCSLLDKKAKEKFDKLDSFIVQTKADGSFAYLVSRLDGSVDVITRAGSKYPQEFAKKLCKGLEAGKVVVGELEVFEKQVVEGWGETAYLLDRKTGNGILNSALKTGEIEDKYFVQCIAWDMLTQNEFESGKSNRPYVQRLDDFKISGYSSLCENISIIPTWEVKSLEQAFTIYAEHTSEGLEGCVIKTKDFLWKDGTSKDCVKMKVEFEIDLEITHVTEGTGKASGMMGAVGVKSRCGGLVSDVGTGWADDARKTVWSIREQLVGRVLAVKANDIISKRGSDVFSLFLPVALEIREDKTIADSLEDCQRILDAAKGLK